MVTGQGGAGEVRRGRVAVIGDLAGHLDDLQTELVRLGADPASGRLPDDLTIVQVGDIVHRGPASEAVVALIDGYLTRQPGRWIQLVGNHEAQYLRQPAFAWPERIGLEAIDTLRRWWATGQMRAAAAVLTDSENFLVTHAGMTAEFWRGSLGALNKAPLVVAALNALIETDEETLFRPGRMLQGRRPDRRVGPIWAAAATELVPSWMNTRLPFSQIHGHTTTYDWSRNLFLSSDEIAVLTEVDPEAKHESVILPGGRIIGIDPGHGQQPERPWRAWEIADATAV